MALDQSALLEVLDALRNADAGDRITQAAETIYRALIDAEVTALIGAGPHERTETRTNQRNGSRPRTLNPELTRVRRRLRSLPAGPDCGHGRVPTTTLAYRGRSTLQFRTHRILCTWNLGVERGRLRRWSSVLIPGGDPVAPPRGR